MEIILTQQEGDLNLSAFDSQIVEDELESKTLSEVQSAIGGQIERFVSKLGEYLQGEATMLNLVA